MCSCSQIEVLICMALVDKACVHRLMTLIGMAEQVLNTSVLGYSPPEFSSTSKPCPGPRQPAHAAWPHGRRARLRATSSLCADHLSVGPALSTNASCGASS